ncbi:ATP-binding protein [Dethiosulfatarculus sandiegensis]|uniref:endopeptidase La n=1 Tax=Dethiosulfatarculus sandiegensis TaxID=1429043 RepID=A0A0D2HNT2_9BACT|nr:ATP-binding protein [Dethiosulfatarculus sandiegensis]KIX12228.1 ATP-dependent protease [Dethiosulfatarculus sandiegensis]
MPQAKVSPLPLDLLRRRFDPEKIPFENSKQCKDHAEKVLGQDRAKEALEFGLEMKSKGYHVFVAGPPRTGKTHLVMTYLEDVAKKMPPPPDWVYVYNFAQPEKPRILRLPQGGGKVMAREMEDLLLNLGQKIPEVFDGEKYSKKKETLTNDFKHVRTEIFSNLDKEARESGYVLKFEPTGIMVAPADEDGRPLSEATIREMTDDEREELRTRSDRIQARVTEGLRQLGTMEKALGERMEQLDREMVLFAVGHLFDELFDKYSEQLEVMVYLEQVRENIVKNFEKFKKRDSQAQMPVAMGSDEPSFQEYKVNVFVDNSELQGAPVVEADHPTFPNLFGRIERQARMGALFTDFTMLKPGALHLANGGFLVIPMLEMLRQWLPWDGLKRALRKDAVEMEDPMEQMGFTVTKTMKPEAMPLNIKVVLVGDGNLYQLLHNYDPQFSKLFKVRAQMAERMDWKEGEVRSFLSHVCRLNEKEESPPLNRSALARLVELAGELAGDRERLTLRLSEVDDLVLESGYMAQKAGHNEVMGEDVERAIQARRRRASMLEERLREAVTRGFINVETQGTEVGQINGLAVLDSGDHAFGTASRITASAGLGKKGVLAIDRESELSGPFHTKGVLILAGFLNGRFASKRSLALTASLVFEQSYSMIDGDSASLAELLTLLSALSKVPLRQDLAVTGSVSQKGQVQAIGGVNQKVEGFYRLCRERGFTGTQGVVIPRANVKNLMLDPEIVDSCSKGDFRVFAVDTVEQALEVFTNKKAGRLKKDGAYTQNSVYAKVADELERLRLTAIMESASKGK